MRTLFTFIFSAACVAALSQPANAQWYVGADGGVNFLENADISGRGDDGSFHIESSSKTGYALLLQGGYDFGGPKAELEVGYRNAGLKSVTDGDEVGGTTSSLSVMANGIYEFMPKSSWHPFLGAGIGIARISARWKEGGDNVVTDSDWQFAYQGLAGVSYDINKNWALKAQYRYFATLDPELSDHQGTALDTEYKSHSVLVGFTYSLSK